MSIFQLPEAVGGQGVGGQELQGLVAGINIFALQLFPNHKWKPVCARSRLEK